VVFVVRGMAAEPAGRRGGMQDDLLPVQLTAVTCFFEPGTFRSSPVVGARQQQQQQQQQMSAPRSYLLTPRPGGEDPSLSETPSFSFGDILEVFLQTDFGDTDTDPEALQQRYIEGGIVGPRTRDLDRAWKGHVDPLLSDLAQVAAELRAGSPESQLADLDFVSASSRLMEAHAELAGFEFTAPHSTDQPWWRSVRGKQGFVRVETERLDEHSQQLASTFSDGAMQSLSSIVERTASRLAELKNVQKDLEDQLRSVAGLIGGQLGLEVGLQLPLHLLGPAMPVLLSLTLGVALHDYRKRLDVLTGQTQAYMATASDEKEIAVLKATIPRLTSNASVGIIFLMSAWFAHSIYYGMLQSENGIRDMFFSTFFGVGVLLFLLTDLQKQRITLGTGE